ncbi:MAG TPA: hypothetical protein VN516_09860, partial [Candidatus Baltobacteraceae bacterium]|nr:hypothetical protein [Candidatus Baltobacteraceae bacterium]
QYETILCPDVPLPLHPIPFFGVIDKARAITVGLNPSPTEFTTARLWPKIMSPCELTQRLVRYFQPSEVMPHHWFSDLQKSLETVRCPYYFAAAHVDASPWTTHAPRYLTTKRQRDLYNQLLADGIDNWLPKTFEFCKDTVKLVVILRSSDAPGEAEMARLPRIKEIIRRSFGERCKVVVKTRDEFYQWTLDDQNKLIRFLDFENVFP